MSPTQLDGKATSYPSPLKINKDSHFIKKPPTSPPPVASSAAKHPHRQPVIIYTHSPKIIHTHPRDFMALVQKLTGQSPSDSESVAHRPPPPKQEPPPVADHPNKNHRRPVAAAASDDTDSSSSVVTDENCASMRVRNVQIKSCFPPPPPPPATMTTAFYDHPPPINPCFNNMNIPFFPSPSSGVFYSSSTLAHQPFFGNYNDSSLLLMNNNNINIRSSISSSSSSSSSSSTFDGMARSRSFASEKCAVALLFMALILAFLPLKYIVLFIFLEIFTKYSPLRKQSTERWTRRLREWWFSIPAAPVVLERAKEDKKRR